MGPDQGFVDLRTSVAQIPRSDSTPQQEPWSGGKRLWVQGWDTERTLLNWRAILRVVWHLSMLSDISSYADFLAALQMLV